MNYKKLQPISKVKNAVKPPTLSGVWANELGSEMTIDSFDGKTFSGSYKSAVSAGGGAASGTLVGTVAGDAISFLVNWSESFASVTAWTGLVLADEEQVVIYALWQLASTPEDSQSFWEAINAGADVFLRQD